MPPRKRLTCAAAAAAAAAASLSLVVTCHGFTAGSSNSCSVRRQQHLVGGGSDRLSRLHVYAPPGSGYVRSDMVDEDDGDEVASESHPELTASDISQISPRAFPKTYEPMLEYPGTMRPGRTPENMPYHDLPGLGINDPDPVPWPHFQEIEWHHKWDPPHEQALAMEEFIEVQGRWATVEDEAEMRMGMRRGVRERREMEETLPGASGGDQMVIMDDDDEDDSEDGSSIGIGLGEGVEALLKGSAVATSAADEGQDDDEEEEDEEEDDDDDFLLDLVSYCDSLAFFFFMLISSRSNATVVMPLRSYQGLGDDDDDDDGDFGDDDDDDEG